MFGLSAVRLLAQDTLQVSSSVVRILSEDLENQTVVVAADLSADTFKEDIAAVSKLILTRGTQKISLEDSGLNGDAVAGDGIFTTVVPFGGKTATEIKTFLTTGPFVIETVSDFGANPPLPTELKLQKISPADDKGNTVKIIADMTSATTVLAGRKIFNVKVGSINARFRDDGLRNDDKPNDMQFTASMKSTPDQIRSFLTANASAAKLLGSNQTVFVGRSMVTIPVVAFNSAQFNAGLATPLKTLAPFVVDRKTLPPIRDKCLMVNDISVVEDPARTYDPFPFKQVPNPAPRGNPNGCWSFGKLIAAVAGKATPEEALSFTTDWVDNNLFSAAVNARSGDTCLERSISKKTFVRAWLKNSGAALPASGIPADWKSKVKVSGFPVRLTAIINRLDLRGSLAFGLSNVGEGRFVFCFVDSNLSGAYGASMDGFGSMTVILEYGLPLADCHALEAYANGWFNLRTQPWGTGTNSYNSKLQALTDQFTALNAAPAKQNGSALNHLRTSEFLQRKTNLPTTTYNAAVAAPHDWVIRDFKLADTGKLSHAWDSEGPEPGFIWNGPKAGTPRLANLASFVNSAPFKGAPKTLLFDAGRVPDNLAAIYAPMDLPGGTIWQGSSLATEKFLQHRNTRLPSPQLTDHQVRREFAMTTCSGCHSAETRISPFTHVKPRAFNQAAMLSSFMVGSFPTTNPIDKSHVVDPAFPTDRLVDRDFNEAFRRALDLVDLVFNFKCEPTSDPYGPLGSALSFTPLPTGGH